MSGEARCRSCGAALHQTLVDLGKSPLCETFLSAAERDQMEPFFPLHVLICESCWLVQLKEYVSPDGIFTDRYPYFSSYSTSWVAHSKAYCEAMTRRLNLDARSFVVELACNDGYLLQHFPPLGVTNMLGVEPAANVAAAAREKGVPVLVEFFGRALAERIVAERGHADLVLGNNVLAHVPDLNDFLGGAAALIKPEGTITFEFPYLRNLLTYNQFDTIYHEHFCYFSGTAIDNLRKRHGLIFADVEHLPTHGGSLRVFLTKRGEPSAAVQDLLASEVDAGMRSMTAYSDFAARVHETKRRLLRFLIDAKEAGKSVCGYGAPGKGNTLLNYCGIGPDLLSFTVDRNPEKHGRYTPGTHIPIYPVEAIDEARPDYILLLPWNLRQEITEQMSHVGAWGAKFVLPIPEVTIVEPVAKS
ncbi:MAG: class I SAM-dependent methyltransferase [Hyphomonadaceae bacterium]|nr:class I SAM-dependent methyltransferase [Hyphomonadaceae bacterium]